MLRAVAHCHQECTQLDSNVQNIFLRVVFAESDGNENLQSDIALIVYQSQSIALIVYQNTSIGPGDTFQEDLQAGS